MTGFNGGYVYGVTGNSGTSWHLGELAYEPKFDTGTGNWGPAWLDFFHGTYFTVDTTFTQVALAPTMDANGCEFLGWKDPTSGALMWGVETFGLGSCLIETTATTPGVMNSAPAVASFVHPTVVGAKHLLFQNYWAFSGKTNVTDMLLQFNTYSAAGTTSGSWIGWTTRPASDGKIYPGSSPAAISVVDGTVHVFVKGTDGNLYWRSINAATGVWNSWTNLGMPGALGIGQTIGVGAVSSSQIDVCVTAAGDSPWVACKSLISGTWDTSFRSCGNPVGVAATLDSPTVSSDGTHTIVMVRNTAGHNVLYGRTCDH